MLKTLAALCTIGLTGTGMYSGDRHAAYRVGTISDTIETTDLEAEHLTDDDLDRRIA